MKRAAGYRRVSTSDQVSGESLEIQEKAFGSAHPTMAQTWEDYAELSRRLGDEAEAQRAAARAAEMKQELEADGESG